MAMNWTWDDLFFQMDTQTVDLGMSDATRRFERAEITVIKRYPICNYSINQD